MEGSGAIHESSFLTGDAAAVRDLGLATALASPAQILASVEAGHELAVAYPDSPIVGGDPSPEGLGIAPGGRIPDAGPLVRPDGSVASLRDLLRDPGVQLWIAAGVGPPDAALALAERFAPTVRTRVNRHRGAAVGGAARRRGARRRGPPGARAIGGGGRRGPRRPAGRLPRLPL